MFIFEFSLPLGNYCKDEVESRNYRKQLLFLFSYHLEPLLDKAR
jgi:hypothetical protein